MAQVNHHESEPKRQSPFTRHLPGAAGDNVTKRVRCIVQSLVVLLLSTGWVDAGKTPLRPEELEEQSHLIVVGQVASHYELEKANKDGSQTTHVYLKVQILEVEKGTDATPDETIDVACWVITKAPRQGTVWDTGHTGIPAGFGKARFYLQRHATSLWNAIYPNGIERLDDGPTLNYPMAPPDPPPSWALALGGGGALFLLATLAFTWLFLSRPGAGRGRER